MGCLFNELTRREELPVPSRLHSLLERIANAVEQSDLRSALRLADGACRVAPEDLTCRALQARLLISSGQPGQAMERLIGRSEPELVVLRGIALAAMGQLDEASILCEKLLSSYSTDAFADVTELASSICAKGKYLGWIGSNSRMLLTGQAEIDGPVDIVFTDRNSLSRSVQIPTDENPSFAIDVPANFSGRIDASVSGAALLGGSISWPPDVRLSGWALADDGVLFGRVGIDWDPALPLSLKVKRSGIDLFQHVVTPAPGSREGTTFSIPLDAGGEGPSPLDVYVELPDRTEVPLLPGPVYLNANRRELAPKNSDHPRPSSCDNPYAKDKIDIVIPAFAGAAETLRCIQSVLATTSAIIAEVIVVDDASPEVALREALQQLASQGRITLLANASNIGFPGSANRGMRAHPDRDIVLLNSDTEVFSDWLERLCSAAYRDQDVGTVTPLGEAASIVSYEQSGGRSTDEAMEIDRIARIANARNVVEIPVGVGFCLYIKRACLSEVGDFDQETFGKGYGEENDFCLRAGALNWKHVAATDIFVRHSGGTSFGRSQLALRERNSVILGRRYPGYDALVHQFHAVDPLLEARRSIDLARLVQHHSVKVLLVNGSLLGGVKRHVDSRQNDLFAAGRTVLVLQPADDPERPNELRLIAPGLSLQNLRFRAGDLPLLRSVLSELELEHIELHHFLDLGSETLELVCALGVPYHVYVHDYSWICPRISLANAEGYYCGEPGIDECETCIRKLGTYLEPSLTVRALRDRSQRILHFAAEIVVPSIDVRARLARYFPDVPIQVRGWETSIDRRISKERSIAGPVRVAVLGGISSSKGYSVLLDCARDSVARSLNLEFVVIGFTQDDEALRATGRVFVTGPYVDKEVEMLLEREQCHVVLLPSIVPETWCYALSHALAAGYPIVAFDLGAVAERLHDRADAWLLPLYSSPEVTNNALLNAARTTYPNSTLKETEMAPDISAHKPVATENLTTSLQFLPLPAGIYTFTVKGGASDATAPDQLALPAVQVGVVPASSEGTVEFVSRVQTTDRWLSRERDMIIAKISGGNASLMLTSLREPDSPMLGINIQRLNADAPFSDHQDGQPNDGQSIPAHILLHIHRLGDIPFHDGWAGCIGDRLWIEAFAIGAAGKIPAEMFQYCGVTADGLQTPWLSNQVLCGSRGRATPMVGFAIRLRPEIAEEYDCTYTGQFVSGRARGPFQNGDLCTSDLPNDPLWGIEVAVTEREKALANSPDHETQSANRI